MKVARVMSKTVDYVTPETSIKDVSRIIFGRGINGVPVCKGRKIVGFITEKDILSKFYPSIQEFVEDPFRSSDFEAMEKKVPEVFSLKAKDVMSFSPVIATPEMPLLRAHSLMLVNEIGRMPVVDEKSNLVGMISKGDIFRAAIGDSLPVDTQEEYHDWLSRHYDLFTNWNERLKNEIPGLIELFKKEKISTILDIGCGTGEHDIALAKKGFKVLGLEKSKSMYDAAIYKKNKLTKEVREKVDFVSGDYKKLLDLKKEKYDAAIFMGNALPHLASDYNKIFNSTIKTLSSASLIILQVINFEKVFNIKNRVLEFNFPKSPKNSIYEHGFLEFYDPPRKDKSIVTLNMFIFNFDGKGWHERSRNSTEIAYLKQEDIVKLLKREGFNKISFYGSMFRKPLFKGLFKPLESDWLTVVAKKQ